MANVPNGWPEHKGPAVIKRETGCLYHGRPLMVAAHPTYLEIWPKGKGQPHRFTVDYQTIYEVGGKLAYRAQNR